MALEWQKIELPFGAPNSGLGESTDPHQLPPVKLVQAENLEVNQLGRLDKRRGTSRRDAHKRGSQSLTDTLIATPNRLIEVEDHFEDFVNVDGKFAGHIARTHVETSTVSMRQDLSVKTYDVVTLGNRLYYFYESGGKIYLAERDLETNQWISHDRLAGSVGQFVRAILVGETICVFWQQDFSNHLIFSKYDPSTNAITQIDVGVIPHNGLYDVSAIDDTTFALAYVAMSGPSGGVVGGRLDKRRLSDGDLVSPGSYRTFGIDDVSAVAVKTNGNRVAVSWYDYDEKTLHNVYTALVDADSWNWVLTATQLDTYAVSAISHYKQYGIEKITIEWIDSNRWLTVYTISDFPPDTEWAGLIKYDERMIWTHMRSCSQYGIESGRRSVPHVVPVSKAWKLDDRVMICTAPVRSQHGFRKNRDYPSMHVLELRDDRDPRITALFALGNGTYWDPATEDINVSQANLNCMPHAALTMPIDGYQEAVVPYLARRLPWEYRGDQPLPVNVNWLESARVSRKRRTGDVYAEANRYEWTPQLDTIGGTSYIAGALPMFYDGNRMVEHNYVMPPIVFEGRNSWNVQKPSLNEGLQSGTYQYVAVYQWKNALGQIEYSQVSPPLQIKVEGVPEFKGAWVELYVRPLPLTQKDNVTISIYRTQSNLDSGYYLISNPVVFDEAEPNRTIRNNKKGEYLHFRDELDDKHLAGNPMLYTSGNVLESDPSGPTKQVLQAKNRLWALDSNGTRILYSKPAESHEVASFSGFQSIEIQSEEPLSAIGSLDDRIVAFSRSRAWIVYGDGPNRAGVGGAFSEPQEISVPAGPVGPSALCSTKHGLVFIGTSGIYLMSRAGQVEEIGADVKETLKEHGPYWIVRHLPGRKQIRVFGSAHAPVLVWNYEHNQWTTFTYHNYEHGIVSPVVLPASKGEPPGSRVVALELAPGQPGIVEELEQGNLDDGEYVSSVIETGHIQLSGLQGYQRVRDMSFLLYDQYKGNRFTNYTITVALAADDSDFYGSATLRGSQLANDRGSQGRVTVARQLCRSIRVRIEDERDDDETEPDPFGTSFLGLAFNVGMMRGTTRLMTSAKRGVR